jgi:trehalose synthase
VTDVELEPSPLECFVPIIGADRHAALDAMARRVAAQMRGRTMWHLNSTVRGGGVAELLGSLLPYLCGAGIDARWLVIDAADAFFTVSKRLHNRLHGDDGDGGPLGADARRTYDETMARNAADLPRLVRPGDIVVLHDPQTAGLAGCLTSLGAKVAWRCHVGVDEPNDRTQEAWAFLGPHVAAAHRYVFTCAAHVWPELDGPKVRIIPPSIDAFATKNCDVEPPTVDAILAAAGIIAGDGGGGEPAFRRRDGAVTTVARRATLATGPVPDGVPLVVQVSRWDALKDPVGLVRAFATHVAPTVDGHLVVAGPQTDSVDDDPEQAAQLAAVTEAWRALDDGVRSRVTIASLPMADEHENAAIVNALQRRAAVIVQKSLAEGFGLTVAEAMWKQRPVVASARGGIVAQIEDGETGVLLRDPTSAAELGAAVRGLLLDELRAARLGAAARQRVRDESLTPRELVQHLELIEELLALPE